MSGECLVGARYVGSALIFPLATDRWGTIYKWMNLDSVDASILCTALGSSVYIYETNQLLKSTKKYQPNQPTHKTNSTTQTNSTHKTCRSHYEHPRLHKWKVLMGTIGCADKTCSHHRKLLSTTKHITFKNFAGQPISGTKRWVKMYFGNLPLHHWHHDKNMSHCNIRFPTKFFNFTKPRTSKSFQ